MKKEDFERYVTKQIPIKIRLKTGFVYRGNIIHLSKNSLVLNDKKLGEITIDYSDVASPIVPLGKGDL